MKIFLSYGHDSNEPLIEKIKEYLSKDAKRTQMHDIHRVLFVIALILSFSVAQNVYAQTQQGFVKTIGRPDKPGIPLENVTIQMVGMVNATMSSASGEFYLSAYNKKDGDAIKLLRVQKNGYELKDKDMIGRSLVLSSHVPIYITMVDTRQLEADKRRIEDNARRVAEKNYQKKLKEIEKENKKHKLSAEKYRQELDDLQEKYEKYLSLIGDMAERYARTDYDQLDSIDIEINICIENGELEKADSLIHTVFDPSTVAERNRAAKKEIEERIKFAQAVIDKANEDKEAILRDIEYAKQIAILSESLAREYIAQGAKEKALQNLQKSLDIKKIVYDEGHPEVIKLIQQIEELKK
jgi:tetratricopeptide (TPR) repeat protein